MNFHEKLVKALGPLGPLYEYPAMKEIIIDSDQEIFTNHDDDIQPAQIVFKSREALEQTLADLLAFCEYIPEPGQTVIDLRLEHNANLLAVLQPTALDGPKLVIRKLPEPFLTWEKLIEYGSVTSESLDFLQSAITHRQKNDDKSPCRHPSQMTVALHKNCLNAIARRCNRSANACRTAADNEHFSLSTHIDFSGRFKNGPDNFWVFSHNDHLLVARHKRF